MNRGTAMYSNVIVVHRDNFHPGRLKFGGGRAVVTEVHSLTATKAGQNCHGRRKQPVEFQNRVTPFSSFLTRVAHER